jgi:hypothetical protein
VSLYLHLAIRIVHLFGRLYTVARAHYFVLYGLGDAAVNLFPIEYVLFAIVVLHRATRRFTVTFADVI